MINDDVNSISIRYGVDIIAFIRYNGYGGECMASGKLADNNTRYSLTIPKDLKTQLEMLAEKQNRSLNNLIVTILKNYVSDSAQEG